MPEVHEAFATCPKGLEGLLLAEIRDLGGEEARETVAGVAFRAPRAGLYRICLWSRLANRVLLRLADIDARDGDALYAGVKEIPWPDHFAPDTTFAVDFSGTGPAIRDTRFGAQRTKDAVVDLFRERTGGRPSVDTAAPGIRINVRLSRGRAAVCLDLSGESLHRRGYREAGGAAPLKENLAAAILLRAGWPEIAAAGGALIDPLCGSGTLLVEGTLMAMGIAPGLARTGWGFDAWHGHDAADWREVRAEAEAARAAPASERWPEIHGFDASGRAVKMAERNAAAAGLADRIRVRRRELAELAPPPGAAQGAPPAGGLVVANPPYGERIGDEASLVHLYHHLGARLAAGFQGWRAAVFTGNPELGKTMGIRAVRRYRLYNGAIPCLLLLFDVEPRHLVARRDEAAGGAPSAAPRLGPGAGMFANRLRKNLKRLERWRRESGVTCFRAYDADMPEYAVCVDVYGDRAHVAEYRAPSTVDPDAAAARLRDVMAAVPAVLGIPADRLAIKERRRQRGREQYGKRRARGEYFAVREGAVELLVNLHDYLDTGLFLDHRRLRLALPDLVRGKRFLNLFCYTGAATVHAAVGGARFSVSVDLSRTYLDWARRNLARNGIAETRHQLVQADCLPWLDRCRDRFDTILLDPPTFSNSKRTGQDMDLQRDHGTLVESAMARLAPGGLLVFSANRRKFDLDAEIERRFAVEDRTEWSLDPDFSERRLPHRCWFVRHRK